MINKSEIIRTLLVVWILATTSYVAYDLWNDYKIKGIEEAYRVGASDIVNGIFQETEKMGCQPFKVFDKEKEVELINAACISQQDIKEGEKK